MGWKENRHTKDRWGWVIWFWAREEISSLIITCHTWVCREVQLMWLWCTFILKKILQNINWHCTDKPTLQAWCIVLVIWLVNRTGTVQKWNILTFYRYLWGHGTQSLKTDSPSQNRSYSHPKLASRWQCEHGGKKNRDIQQIQHISNIYMTQVRSSLSVQAEVFRCLSLQWLFVIQVLVCKLCTDTSQLLKLQLTAKLCFVYQLNWRFFFFFVQ